MPTVNTNIYGTPDQWGKLKASEGDSDKLNTPMYPYFGDTPKKEGTTNQYMMGTLSTANLNGILKINEPIDLSICPIGCDSGFSARHITYYANANNPIPGQIKTKVDSVAPMFFYNYRETPATIEHYSEFLLTAQSSIPRSAWAYDMTAEVVQGTNYNHIRNDDGILRPIVSMPVKDAVWCIFIACFAGDVKDLTSFPTPLAYDLNTYINGTVDVDGVPVAIHDRYPNIVNICALLFITTDSVTTRKRDGFANQYGAAFNQNMEDFAYSDTQTIKYLRYSANDFYTNNSGWRYTNTDGTIKNDTRSASAYILHGARRTRVTTNNSQKNTWYGVTGQNVDVFTQKDSTWAVCQNTDINSIGISNLEEYCYTQCAYFGMFFTGDYTVALNGALDDDKMCLGVIDDAGVTHGNYTQGQANKEQKQWDWDDIISNSPYDPTKKPDPSIYDDETKLAGDTSAGTAFLHVYECSYMTINNLKKYLYQIVAPESTSETLTQKFLTVNPIDCITGCYEFPFTVRDRFSTPSNIVIGNTTASGGEESPIVGYALQYTLRILDFGAVEYYPFYDDFRDYEPYSEALLYIPYVGYIPISPSEFMGHNIGLKMICDLLTGSCQALVYKDGLVIESSSGNIGTQVPITGIQQADYSNAIHSASTRLLSSQVASVASFGGAVSSLVTGNALGAVSSIANVAQSSINLSNANYELEHTKVPFKQSGTASPNVNFANEQQARLILKRPLMDTQYNQVAYGHTVGFACLITAQLSSFTGFTQTTNVDLSGITATATEKQMIQQLLQSGVYL